MTRSEFVAQMNRLKHKARQVLYFGGTFVLVFNGMVIYYLFQLYPLRGRTVAALPWYVGAFAVTSVAVLGLTLALRWTIARYGPICPACGTPATWAGRAQVLSSGRCAKCGSDFVETEG